MNEAAGEWYFNKELHQQMLWWVQLPDLLELAAAGRRHAGKDAGQPRSQSIKAIERRAVQEACEQAEEAGYRIGKKKEPVRQARET